MALFSAPAHPPPPPFRPINHPTPTQYPFDWCYIDPSSTNTSTAVFYYGIVGRGLFSAVLDYTLKIQQATAAQDALLAIGPGALAFQTMDREYHGQSKPAHRPRPGGRSRAAPQSARLFLPFASPHPAFSA